MRFLGSSLLFGLALTALSTSAYANGTVLDVCESIDGNSYVFEMNGKSGLLAPNDHSALIGRFTATAKAAGGFAAVYQNNWNGKQGYANFTVKCAEVSFQRGRLTFTQGFNSFRADFVFKTGYDGLVLMRTDAKHAIVGEAVLAAPIAQGTKICGLLKKRIAGSLDGLRPKVHAARLLQLDFLKPKPSVVEVDETVVSAASTRQGTVDCTPTGSTSARFTMKFPRGGNRVVDVFLGGGALDTMPAIDTSPERTESGWLFVQPDPIQIPG